MKTLVLFNPSSGNGSSLKKKKKIISMFKKYEVKNDFIMTKSEDDMRSLINDSVNKYNTIVGVGGDTTIKIIAEELMKYDLSKTPSIGMIGTGSVNSIMKSLGFDTIEKSVIAIKENKVSEMDVGTVIINSEEKEIYFIGSMSLGLGTTVNKYVASFNKKHKLIAKTGKFGQFIAGLLGAKASFKNNLIPVKIKIFDGDVNLSENFSLLTILNTDLFGHNIRFFENCSPFDGKLNCIIINTNSFMETLSFYSNIEKRKKDTKAIDFNDIRMEFETPTDIQLDGDVYEGIRSMRIFVNPKKLKIITSL